MPAIIHPKVNFAQPHPPTLYDVLATDHSLLKQPANLPAAYRKALRIPETEHGAIVPVQELCAGGNLNTLQVKKEAVEKWFGAAALEGIIKGTKALIVMIEKGLSKNRNRYAASVLETAVPLFQGAKVFYDHRFALARSFRDLAGEITQVRWDSDTGTMYGIFEALSNDTWLQSVMKEKPHLVGFSIFTWVKAHEDKEVQEVIIDEIVGVQSVDLVDNPAAGGRLVEVLEAVVDYAPTQGIDKDSPWSFSAEDGNAIIEHGGWAAYKRAHAWYEGASGETPETRDAYKLPHHKLVNGRLKTFFNGVVAATAALAGARSPVDIPAADVPGVKAHLRQHYEQADATPPDSLLENKTENEWNRAAFIRHHIDHCGMTESAVQTILDTLSMLAMREASEKETEEMKDKEKQDMTTEAQAGAKDKAQDMALEKTQLEKQILEAQVRHEAELKAKDEELAKMKETMEALQAQVQQFTNKQMLEDFLAKQEGLLDAVKEAVRKELADAKEMTEDLLKKTLEKWQSFAEAVAPKKEEQKATTEAATGIAPKTEQQEAPKEKPAVDEAKAMTESFNALVDTMFGIPQNQQN